MTDTEEERTLPASVIRVEDANGTPLALACKVCDIECSVVFSGDALKAFVEEHRLCKVLIEKDEASDPPAPDYHSDGSWGAGLEKAYALIDANVRAVAAQDMAQQKEIDHLKQIVRSAYYWAKNEKHWRETRNILGNQMHAMGEWEVQKVELADHVLDRERLVGENWSLEDELAGVRESAMFVLKYPGNKVALRSLALSIEEKVDDRDVKPEKPELLECSFCHVVLVGPHRPDCSTLEKGDNHGG